ncbi:hypothetical protein [Leisingera sp. NJS204]|uniref:hypothetical protein n=1 Tax=Leisingera sp. NJS204 TaxID=2508307 RepID=UPI0013E95057|nr:hypothetical protein [Leisingera sp. NJS204]
MNGLSLPQRDQLLLRFFACLDEHGVSYCVLSGLAAENPEYDLDVDISAAPGDRALIARLVRQFAQENGLLLLFDIWSGTCSRAYTLVQRGSAGRVMLKLDIMAGYGSFRTGEVLRHAELARNRVYNGMFWTLSPQSELAYLAVRHVLKNDNRAYRAARIGDLRATVNMHAFKSAFAPVILDAAEAAAARRLPEQGAALRRRLARYGKARMGRRRRLIAAVQETRRHLQRIRHPVGCSVAFLGPDGSGKSTLIAALHKRLSPVFHGVTLLYWRPRLLPTPGRLKFWNPAPEKQKNPNPHDVVPHGRAVSLARLLYFSCDYILGHFLVVLPRMIRKDLVVFDRFLNDIRLDQLRYRMTVPARLLRLIERLAPRPDIIFALHGPPEVLHGRKPELELQETARQVDLLQQMARENRHFAAVQVDRDIEHIVDEIIETLLAACAENGGNHARNHTRRGPSGR